MVSVSLRTPYRPRVQLARKIQLVPVRQMPAMRQVEPQNRVARLQQRHVGCGIRLRAGVRLHIRVLRAEKLLRPVARQVLHHIRVLAAAVVALARIAFGILVGEDRSRRPPAPPGSQSSPRQSSPAPRAGAESRVGQRRKFQGRSRASERRITVICHTEILTHQNRWILRRSVARNLPIFQAMMEISRSCVLQCSP